MELPIFQCMGHMLAHRAWEDDDNMGTISANLALFRMLPLNAFGQLQLVGIVLIPKWTSRTLHTQHLHVQGQQHHVPTICTICGRHGNEQKWRT